MTDNPNPWGISPAQARALDAVIEHDGYKVAADRLGLSVRTVEGHCQAAAALMGCRAGSHSRHLILWDRWRRPVQQGAASG